MAQKGQKQDVMWWSMCGLQTQAPPLNHLQLSVPAKGLFKANVLEKVIQERTGHRPLDALRMYERSTERQHGGASKILAISNKVDYQRPFVLSQVRRHRRAVLQHVQLACRSPSTYNWWVAAPLIYRMALHRRACKRIPWHYRSSQKKR